MPLRTGGRVIGTLHANSARPAAFAEEQLRSLQVLADHAAGAVEQARLREALTDQARLDGALKTGRLLAHELNNQLAVPGRLRGAAGRTAGRRGGEMAREILTAAQDMAALVDRLGRIGRFEETDIGGGPMLDLDAASGEPPA